MTKKVSMTARPAAVSPTADKWVNENNPRTASQGPMQRLTIDLDPDTHKRFKALCAQHGLKMNHEIRNLILNRISALQGEGRA